MRINVNCYAGLREHAPHGGELSLQGSPTPPTPLDVARELSISMDEVAVVFVNGAGVAPGRLADTPLADGDTVGFFPPVGGG